MGQSCQKHCFDPGRFLKTWVVVVRGGMGRDGCERKEKAFTCLGGGSLPHGSLLRSSFFPPLKSAGTISRAASCRAKLEETEIN